jgi:hypothetical protein
MENIMTDAATSASETDEYILLSRTITRERFIAMLEDLPRTARKEIYKALRIKTHARHRRAARAKERQARQSETIWGTVDNQENAQVAEVVIRNWLLFMHGKMVVKFLDHFGVDHDNGLCEEMDWLKELTAEKLQEGVNLVLEDSSPYEVRLYLEYIESPHINDIPELKDAFLPEMGPQAGGSTPAVEATA